MNLQEYSKQLQEPIGYMCGLNKYSSIKTYNDVLCLDAKTLRKYCTTFRMYQSILLQCFRKFKNIFAYSKLCQTSLNYSYSYYRKSSFQMDMLTLEEYDVIAVSNGCALLMNKDFKCIIKRVESKSHLIPLKTINNNINNAILNAMKLEPSKKIRFLNNFTKFLDNIVNIDISNFLVFQDKEFLIWDLMDSINAQDFENSKLFYSLVDEYHYIANSQFTVMKSKILSILTNGTLTDDKILFSKSIIEGYRIALQFINLQEYKYLLKIDRNADNFTLCFGVNNLCKKVDFIIKAETIVQLLEQRVNSDWREYKEVNNLNISYSDFNKAISNYSDLGVIPISYLAVTPDSLISHIDKPIVNFNEYKDIISIDIMCYFRNTDIPQDRFRKILMDSMDYIDTAITDALSQSKEIIIPINCLRCCNKTFTSFNSLRYKFDIKS